MALSWGNYFLIQTGLTALMLATNKEHLEIVKLLLEANASVDRRNKVFYALHAGMHD